MSLPQAKPDNQLPPSLGSPARFGSRVVTVMVKEFREVFRDRRTVISVIISPLLITPALFAVLGIFIGSEARKEKTRVYDVGVIGAEAAPGISKYLYQIGQLNMVKMARDQAESAIAHHKLSAALVLPADADRKTESYSPVSMELLLDAGDEGSQAAAQRLTNGIKSIGDQVVTQRLRANHLPDQFAAPFAVVQKPVKGGGSMGSLILASMLPYLLVISSFGGAIYASFDQVAGEKERGTLETLLVSPASRREIVLGKFFAVAAVCIISSILSVVGIIVSFSLHTSALSALTSGGLHLSGAAIVVSLLMMLPLAVLFAGVLLAVSTFARNQKEAQTYITPILLFVLMPAMFSIFVRADVPRVMAMVPILGTSIIIKQAFSSVYDPTFIALAFGSSLLYGWLAVMFSTRLFEKESVFIKA